MVTMKKIVALVLTKNEEVHLERCLSNVKDIVDDFLIVDSFSTDRTIEIAKKFTDNIIQNEWVNYAMQFNYGLRCLPSDVGWVLRIDADEFVDDKLKRDFRKTLKLAPRNVSGFLVDRRMTFMRKKIKFGGVFPVEVLRIFRPENGFCEERWMDEHIVVTGSVSKIKGEVVDDNLKNLSWWIDKHNSYASREAVDLLNTEFNILKNSSKAINSLNRQASRKRFLKVYLFSKIPLGFRSFLYFSYRYFLMFGFLDGKRGFYFHFLQGFWYRCLVDAKVEEIKRCCTSQDVSIIEAIDICLDIDVNCFD
jgi:glycosyltransferase involved in cell wall biosynthesis